MRREPEPALPRQVTEESIYRISMELAAFLHVVHETGISENPEREQTENQDCAVRAVLSATPDG